MKSRYKILPILLFTLFMLFVCGFSACELLNGLTVKVTSLEAECSKTFYKGDAASNEDFDVTAVYSDGSTKKVTDFEVELNGFTSNVGAAELTFTYEEKGIQVSVKKSFEICAVVLEKISVEYNGRNVVVNGEIDSEKVVVTAFYSNGSTKSVTDFLLTCDTAEIGEKQVTVTYQENGVEKTEQFAVNVVSESEFVTSLTVTHDGTKFEVGDSFRPTTMTVVANFADGHSETLNSKQYNYSGFSSKQVGTVTVTVTFDGVSQDVEIEIINAKLVEIDVVYSGGSVVLGGTLDVDDFYVIAIYENEISAQVFDFEISGFDSETEGEKNVEISYTENGVTVSTNISVNVVAVSVESSVSVHFLELGNKYTGDSVFIKAGDTDILIDAGSRKNSAATICNYINSYCTDGILEYVIVTHAHQDHIAGFVGTGGNGVFANYECKNIIEFARTNSSSDIYSKYVSERNKEVEAGANLFKADDCFNETNGAKREFEITEGVTLEILYNYYYFNSASSENDYSVCVMLHQGENNYLFTGDLESTGEAKMVEYYENQNDPLPHCILYKAGHHGSKTSSSEALMAAITPEYVCVCCCAGSSEYTDNDDNQFPTQEFVNRVAPYTDKIYVTSMVDNYAEKSKWGSQGTVKSMNGNIVFSCVNGNITMTFSGNDLKLKDTEWFKEHRTWPSDGK